VVGFGVGRIIRSGGMSGEPEQPELNGAYGELEA
jgi:hypothetical protein